MTEARTIFVPMKSDGAEPRRVDIGRMSEEEIKSLEKRDPFLYRSIPGVHKAMLSLKDVDHASLKSELWNAETGPTTNVTRKSRLSTECHIDVLLEDALNDEFGGDDFEDGLADLLVGVAKGRSGRWMQ